MSPCATASNRVPLPSEPSPRMANLATMSSGTEVSHVCRIAARSACLPKKECTPRTPSKVRSSSGCEQGARSRAWVQFAEDNADMSLTRGREPRQHGASSSLLITT